MWKVWLVSKKHQAVRNLLSFLEMFLYAGDRVHDICRWFHLEPWNFYLMYHFSQKFWYRSRKTKTLCKLDVFACDNAFFVVSVEKGINSLRKAIFNISYDFITGEDILSHGETDVKYINDNSGNFLEVS